VLANDHNAYAATLARCYVQADATTCSPTPSAVAELNALPGAPATSPRPSASGRRFFHPKNGARVDAIREAIAAKSLPPELESVLLVSLMEAADRVDSTTGVQMAYLKQWARGRTRPQLRVPDAAAAGGAARARPSLPRRPRPPRRRSKATWPTSTRRTTSTAYLGNYHVWESLVRWDKPAVYGVACKRVRNTEYIYVVSDPDSLARLRPIVEMAS
jgi:adenine-specific DNA-methyltransferase